MFIPFHTDKDLLHSCSSPSIQTKSFCIHVHPLPYRQSPFAFMFIPFRTDKVLWHSCSSPSIQTKSFCIYVHPLPYRKSPFAFMFIPFHTDKVLLHSCSSPSIQTKSFYIHASPFQHQTCPPQTLISLQCHVPYSILMNMGIMSNKHYYLGQIQYGVCLP